MQNLGSWFSAKLLTVASMSDFKAKMHQIFKFGWVSTSDVTGETYSTHILLAEFKGPTSKGKDKGIYNTAIAPQATYHSCSTAAVLLCHRHRLSSRPRTLTCSQTAIHSPGLPFDGLHPCNPCNYMHNYPFTDLGGTEGWVGWPIVYTLPTKWLPFDYRLGMGEGKSGSQVLTS